MDLREEVIEALNLGRAPHVEPGLAEALLSVRPRLSATTDLAAAVRQTGVTFVVVPTPSEPGGAFSLEWVRPAFHDLGRALAAKDRWHLVVLTSTVLVHCLVIMLARVADVPNPCLSAAVHVICCTSCPETV